MKTRLAILGAGLMGQAVARLGVGVGLDVRLWARREEVRDEMTAAIDGLNVSAEVATACKDAALILIAVPAGAIREVARELGEVATGDQAVVLACRGVEKGFVLPHEVVRQETCIRKIGILGGPLYAPDLTEGRPLAAVLASRFDEVIAAVQNLVAGTVVHVHPSHDVIGVEVAGAIANVSALAVGMADALDLGETARGVLLTRGLAEAATLGRALGAEPTTFWGLAGVGDLIPRKVASTKRHHDVGAALANGESLEVALDSVDGAVEGVVTAQSAVIKVGQLGLTLPLVQAVARVLGGAEAKAVLNDVLELDLNLELTFARA